MYHQDRHSTTSVGHSFSMILFSLICSQNFPSCNLQLLPLILWLITCEKCLLLTRHSSRRENATVKRLPFHLPDFPIEHTVPLGHQLSRQPIMYLHPFQITLATRYSFRTLLPAQFIQGVMQQNSNNPNQNP